MRKLRKSILYWIILAPLMALVLFPFAVMIVTALKPAEEVLHPTWWPTAPQWDNFVRMWQAANFGPAFANSLYTASLSTIVALAVSIPAAYALSRYRVAGRGAVNAFLLVSQMISPVVLVLGLFRLAVGLGLIDGLTTLVYVYAAFNVAFSVWMLKSYFDTIPHELEEAAWLEGASPARTLWVVFLPLAVPAVVVTALFTFINAWNEFVIALTMLRREGGYTLPIQIFSLVSGRYTVEWQYVMAAALAATVPVAVLFSWLLPYLVRGRAIAPNK